MDALPSILAGPVLGRLTRTHITVWVALSRDEPVVLHLGSGGGEPPEATGAVVTRLKAGSHLWLAVITAPAPQPGGEFIAGTTYKYFLDSPAPTWDPPDWEDLSVAGTLPTFKAPPESIEDVVLLHTSCRDARGGGMDALPLIADYIESHLGARPHLMIWSGDQIYADTIPPTMSPRVRRIAADLVGINESNVFPASKIGGRQAPSLNFALTSSVASDHLWTLGEFLATYLLAWSDAAWEGYQIPTWDQIQADPDFALQEFLEGLVPGVDDKDIRHKWDDLVLRTENYKSGTTRVRKVLANVPSLMILDDHEVTDDWNLDYQWANAVYTSEPATRVIFNGLLAYVLCQFWGNCPDRFTTAGSPEAELLGAVAHSGNSPANATTTALLGMPVWNPAAIPASFVDPNKPPVLLRPNLNTGIRYDFIVDGNDGWPLRIIALDERTAREFRHVNRPAARIALDALALMLPPPGGLGPSAPVTVIVAPSPVLGTHIVEHVIQPTSTMLPGGAVFADYESWSANRANYEKLLALSMAHAPVLFFGGDVHYTVTATIDYLPDPTVPSDSRRGVGITSSAARSSDIKTTAISLYGDLLMRLGVERERHFYGFADSFGPLQLPVSDTAKWLPWDEMVDVLLGRVFRAGEEAPVVLSREIAQAYALGPPDWEYIIRVVDDERMPPDDLADAAAVQLKADIDNAPAKAGWSGWDPDKSVAMGRALRASDLHRIGRVFSGLPQFSVVTFEQDSSGLVLHHRAEGEVGVEAANAAVHFLNTTVPLNG